MGVIKHGIVFFRKEGINCPECSCTNYDYILSAELDVVNVDTKDTYIFTCYNCHCKWTERVAK